MQATDWTLADDTRRFVPSHKSNPAFLETIPEVEEEERIKNLERIEENGERTSRTVKRRGVHVSVLDGTQ